MSHLRTLQQQRATFSRIVTLLSSDAYATERTEAVDALDWTQRVIHRLIKRRRNPLCEAVLANFTDLNTETLERLNAVIVAMPDATWQEVSR